MGLRTINLIRDRSSSESTGRSAEEISSGPAGSSNGEGVSAFLRSIGGSVVLTESEVDLDLAGDPNWTWGGGG